MPNDNKFKVNSFYYYASEHKNKLVSEEDIMKIDMTEIFKAELTEMVKQGEIIIINVNGKPRLGKSTLAISIGMKIFNILKSLKMTKKNATFGLLNIARDHQEYSVLMRNPEMAYTVIVTDESNELENTGENVTVERALTDVFSSVQAARYVHRVCCSPRDNVDPNADIHLSVIAVDKLNFRTHCKLYYRYYEGGQEWTQLLGYVNWYVGDLISNWENNVRKLYYNPNRTSLQEKELYDQRKNDWYVEYVIRKHEKMDLLTKEGIFRPRFLLQAQPELKVIDQLKLLARLQVLKPTMVRNFIKIAFRESKIPLSVVGEEQATKDVAGIMDLYKEFYAIKKKLEVDLKSADEGKPILSNEKRDEYEKAILILVEGIKRQEEELNKYAEINDKYHYGA